MTPAERLDQLARGENPLLITKMASGYAVMSETQFLPGYCLLLADPMMGQLNDLHNELRQQFLSDMAKLGDAVLQSTDAVRINYSIYGNLDPFLHAHIFPRYASEAEKYRTLPPFLIPAEVREAAEHRYDPAVHERLQLMIEARLESIESEIGNVLE